MPLRVFVRRSLLRGLVWWTLASIALGTRELYVFHPNLFGV